MGGHRSLLFTWKGERRGWIKGVQHYPELRAQERATKLRKRKVQAHSFPIYFPWLKSGAEIWIWWKKRSKWRHYRRKFNNAKQFDECSSQVPGFFSFFQQYNNMYLRPSNLLWQTLTYIDTTCYLRVHPNILDHIIVFLCIMITHKPPVVLRICLAVEPFKSIHCNTETEFTCRLYPRVYSVLWHLH